MGGGAMSGRPECGFDIRDVVVDELPEAKRLVVGLAQEAGGGGQALIFQKALRGDLASDEQDRSLGMDTYSVSNESGVTVYGGVTGWLLDGDVLVLHFDTVSSKALQLGRECQFKLVVDRLSIARRRDGMNKLLTSGGGAAATTRR
jgi:hypothetical protein